MRVLVVGDDFLDRKGLGQMLATERDVEVVGEAGTAWAAVPLVCELRPDVLVVMLPVADAVQVTRLLAAECPSTRIIALSLCDATDPAGLLSAGAAACVRDTDDLDVLFGAIRDCSAGKPVNRDRRDGARA